MSEHDKRSRSSLNSHSELSIVLAPLPRRDVQNDLGLPEVVYEV